MRLKQNFSISRESFQPNTEVTINGYNFIYTAVADRTEGKGTEVFGILTFPDGKKKSYTEKPVLVSYLNKIAGVTVSRSDASKKETSQSRGASKVVSITNLSEAKIQELVTDRRVKMVKTYNKLQSMFIFDTPKLDCSFYRSLNDTLSEYQKELLEKLAAQREQLNKAKSIEVRKSKLNRIARLEAYINNYDSTVGRLFMNGSDIAMKQAMKLRLTKEERILRAGWLIDSIQTELLLNK